MIINSQTLAYNKILSVGENSLRGIKLSLCGKILFVGEKFLYRKKDHNLVN